MTQNESQTGITRAEVESLLSQLGNSLRAELNSMFNAIGNSITFRDAKVETISFLRDRLSAVENWAANLPIAEHARFTPAANDVRLTAEQTEMTEAQPNHDA